MEAPYYTSGGFSMSMLKKDVQCGEAWVPVTFIEYDVAGARPVDVFNTLVDISGTSKVSANPTIPLGDFHAQGVRGLAVFFAPPLVSEREFVQWQAADANFANEEFWVVFSTQQNEELHKRRPMQQGAVEGQNCLGAYHITNTPNGAHVLMTQHMNVDPPLPMPVHQIEKFTKLSQATVDTSNEVMDKARQLAQKGLSSSYTVVPAFMLEKAYLRPRPKGRTPFLRVAEEVPDPHRTAVVQPSFGPLQSIPIVLLLAACAACIAFISFSVGLSAGKKMRALRERACTEAASEQEVLWTDECSECSE